MISMILLVLHAVQALNEPRVKPEEDKPESIRPRNKTWRQNPKKP
jgi:hypothetical protein